MCHAAHWWHLLKTAFARAHKLTPCKSSIVVQLTAVDGRRAFVTLPNDPELVDILAKNGVDISVSEGEAQGNYVSLLGNLLFPLIAFGGLFFLFRYLLPLAAFSPRMSVSWGKFLPPCTCEVGEEPLLASWVGWYRGTC